MNSVLKFDLSNADIGMAEETIAHRHRFSYNKRVKHEDTTGTSKDNEASNTTAIEPERPGTRKVLRMAKVHSVDIIQTKEAPDFPEKSLRFVRRSTVPNLYSPTSLGSTTPEFNTATSEGFRTQHERRHLAFIRTLERKHKDIFHGEEKGLSSSLAVLDISKPAKLHSRYVIARHSKSAT